MTALNDDFSVLTDYLDQPRELSLETFAKCNAACTFCPYPTLDRIGTKMSDDLIESVMEQMEVWDKPFNFAPFKVNEPFLDKRVLPLCADFNRRIPHAWLRLFTNGSTLTDANVDKIEELERVTHLWVSLNDHRPVEYFNLMGLDFDRTARNLDRLHSRAFPHPVVLSTVGYPNESFRRYCFHRWPKFQSTALKKDAWIDFTDPQITTVPDLPCWRWWELNIMADGRASRCCMDSDGTHGVGDIKKQTLLEIYNAPAWRERRVKLTSRKQTNDVCSTCTY
jgi:hypothetical protein